MPEGTIICVLFAFVLSGAVGMIVYCLRLASKYRRIEADMHCIYKGTMHHVVDIVYDQGDWFMRKVRLHTDIYPYVLDVLISEVRAISLKTAGDLSGRQDGTTTGAAKSRTPNFFHTK